jgi:hypothetical protein
MWYKINNNNKNKSTYLFFWQYVDIIYLRVYCLINYTGLSINRWLLNRGDPLRFDCTYTVILLLTFSDTVILLLTFSENKISSIPVWNIHVYNNI